MIPDFQAVLAGIPTGTGSPALFGQASPSAFPAGPTARYCVFFKQNLSSIRKNKAAFLKPGR
jgi:hypothetical protein